MGATDPGGEGGVKFTQWTGRAARKSQVTRHRRRTEVWTMVFVQTKPGCLVPMWQTIHRTKDGEQVITLHPDDVPRLLQVRSQGPIERRVKVVFQPWES